MQMASSVGILSSLSCISGGIAGFALRNYISFSTRKYFVLPGVALQFYMFHVASH